MAVEILKNEYKRKLRKMERVSLKRLDASRNLSSRAYLAHEAMTEE